MLLSINVVNIVLPTSFMCTVPTSMKFPEVTMSQSPLPAILVSAVDSSVAAAMISLLIGDSQLVEENGDVSEEEGRVWRLDNKYYVADVRLVAAVDEAELEADALSRVQAHLVYLTEAECTMDDGGAAVLERRAGAARGAGHVLLAACDARVAGDALVMAARRLGYELVPLRERAAPDHDDNAPFVERYGVERARAALHAHAWPGLRRHAPPRAAPPGTPAPRDEEAGAVERAELFADALDALGAAREMSPPRRRQQAEALVGAFCRALGLDPLDL